ncbi:Heat shock protein DnaJ domain protein [uncultured Paludibacter sp.]|nr:Heat shock protein DnaJ domain protein [uncultured Paludibacter sp.]
MAGFAKWIGGGLGFVLGGPIGALIGFGLGSFADAVSGSSVEIFTNGQPHQNTQEGDFKMSLLVLIACVMKADGSVKKTELDVAKRFLTNNFDEEGALEALQILKGLLQQNINETEMARQINMYMNYSSKLELVHLLLDIAYADGNINQQELTVIQRIAWGLGVSSLDLQSLQAPYNKQRDTNWAYDALEIKPDATNDEIKKAYRSMAMKYHPDKVQNLGEDVKRKATEKFRAVNEAYEYLKDIRGLK